jgi:hypothetical protein
MTERLLNSGRCSRYKSGGIVAALEKRSPSDNLKSSRRFSRGAGRLLLKWSITARPRGRSSDSRLNKVRLKIVIMVDKSYRERINTN